MLWSHYTTFKVVRSLYCLHYAAFCLVVDVVCKLQDRSATGIGGMSMIAPLNSSQMVIVTGPSTNLPPNFGLNDNIKKLFCNYCY